MTKGIIDIYLWKSLKTLRFGLFVIKKDKA